ncbi:Vancomycin B-type resistance protein VanW, putative [Tumidithrix helvetica PCC 7403]|uniref:VanW family protein n=1 Tax=Tumidithrix helvetica TaxID=3457545 RepID=UPI003CC3BBCC
MKTYDFPKQIKRSEIRLWIGRLFYVLKRQLAWKFSGIKFATSKKSDRKLEKLPVRVFAHQSLLIRQLKDVEMYLQYNKVENLRLAIARIDRVVIKPGEVFSFWYLIGNPTQRRGFKLGMTLNNGKVKPGYGGGLCQLSNLIYWMALHSPLSIKERWRHSYDVFPDVNRSLPFGSGATVAYNYIDLQIANHTGNDYQLCFWLTEQNLCGEIRSNVETLYEYEVFESGHIITGPLDGRYMRHNELFRTVKNRVTGELLKEEFVTENNALMMYAPLLTSGN